MNYPVIPNTRPLSHDVAAPVDVHSLPTDLTHPAPPATGSKSIFAFWHSGIQTLPPYLLRNVINWYRRFSPLGWTIYVIDNVPSSPLNISQYIDISSPRVVPEAFSKGTIDGNYAAQHTSDLIRFPLLLRYGGIYLDVGILQFGDLDALWTNEICNPESPYDFFGFTMGEAPELQIVNFALMSGPDNPLILRAHRILLKLWEGRTGTTGMHKHPLVSHVPLMKVPKVVVIDEAGKGKMVIDDAAMTDYAIQIQCMGAAQGWLDEGEGWDGPQYVVQNCWLLNMIDSVYVHEQATGWSGQRSWELLRQRLPELGEPETTDQALAKKIVEEMVGKSWALKLGHGFAAKLFGGDTLGMLWKKYPGTDCKEGTYAGWLRWAEINCKPEVLMQRMSVQAYKPTMTAHLEGFLKD